MRVIFFGTSNTAVPFLQALMTDHEIAAVVTAPDAKVGRKQTLLPSPVSGLADELKLPVYKPEAIKGNQQFLEELKKRAPDLSVVVDYGKILPRGILDLPKLKTINIHFSLLPQYRGPSPIQYALLDGKTETGASIFILDEKIDTGPILAQEKLVIGDNDTSATLSKKLIAVSLKLLLHTIAGYVNGKIKPIEQDSSQATYTKLITKTDGKIDWQKTAPEIYNQFRAFYPWPGIWTTWQGKHLKIINCEPASLSPSSTMSPSVLSSGSKDLEPNGLSKGEMPIRRSFSEGGEGVIQGKILDTGLIACGQNTLLQIKSLQLAGKSPTEIKSFLNGHKNFIGSQLG